MYSKQILEQVGADSIAMNRETVATEYIYHKFYGWSNMRSIVGVSDCSGLLEVNPRWRFTIRAFTNNFCFIVYVNIWFKNMGVSYTSQKKKTMTFIQIPPRVINSHQQARILYYQPRQELDNLRHLPQCLSWTVVLYETTFLKPRRGRKYKNIQIQIQGGFF